MFELQPEERAVFAHVSCRVFPCPLLSAGEPPAWPAKCSEMIN